MHYEIYRYATEAETLATGENFVIVLTNIPYDERRAQELLSEIVADTGVEHFKCIF